MEDTCVRFLLENLSQLRLHRADLISDVKDQIERLEENLLLFKRFLNEYSIQKREKDGILKEVSEQMREVVYKAEDAVDVYVSQALEGRLKSTSEEFLIRRESFSAASSKRWSQQAQGLKNYTMILIRGRLNFPGGKLKLKLKLKASCYLEMHPTVTVRLLNYKT
ncbi:UNVERIFIED_CONTAM: hypothetical protein Sradi_4075800 [Sesamum radiatum]|uniref:Disease resistance N-terminal domain-containing protein n=1 Tax=Sesamum radiatum TaxID=300843 RepID=A0AAW2PN20_SESRA